MFVYKGKEYESKAGVVRSLYDSGETSLAVIDKKSLATELNMTVQTVHATIMKHIKKTVPKTVGVVSKIVPSITQAKKKLKEKVTKVKSRTKGLIFINDKEDEVKKELMKDPNRIKINFAPNQWGLPITTPPIYVIDENYDPNWVQPSEEVERIWSC